MRIRSIIALVMTLIVLGNSAFADTVVLKSGKRYTGNVTKRDRLQAQRMQEASVGLRVQGSGELKRFAIDEIDYVILEQDGKQEKIDFNVFGERHSPADSAHSPTAVLPDGSEPSWADKSPRQGLDGVLFTFIGQANTVWLTGDFNSWSVTADTLAQQTDERWAITKRLSPGTYRYAYVVDGITLKAEETGPGVAMSPQGTGCLTVTVGSEATGGSLIESLVAQRTPCEVKYTFDLSSRPPRAVASAWDHKPERTRKIYGRIVGFSGDSVSILKCPETVEIPRQSIRSLKPLSGGRGMRVFLGLAACCLGVLGVALVLQDETGTNLSVNHSAGSSFDVFDGLNLLSGTCCVFAGLRLIAVPSPAQRELKRLNASDCR